MQTDASASASCFLIINFNTHVQNLQQLSHPQKLVSMVTIPKISMKDNWKRNFNYIHMVTFLQNFYLQKGPCSKTDISCVPAGMQETGSWIPGSPVLDDLCQKHLTWVLFQLPNYGLVKKKKEKELYKLSETGRMVQGSVLVVVHPHS